MTKVNNQIKRKKSLKIDVSINDLTTPIDYEKDFFVEIEPYYSDKMPKPNNGILNNYNLIKLLDRLNNLNEGLEKDKCPAILKGLYLGGTKGVYCIQAAPFLFIDIDVKKDENRLLNDKYKNSTVFDFLRKICVVTFRSYSGLGMAGLLYVPCLQNYLNNDRQTHKAIGDKVCLTLSEYINQSLSIYVEFDNAQNKFRQIRYLAYQVNTVHLNKTPKQFDVSISSSETKTYSGFPVYTANYTAPGTIEDQYNKNTSIHDELLNCNFEQVSQTRYKHYSTTSSSSGEINNNVFYNYSSSFSSKKSFTPFTLHLECNDKSKNDFILQLQNNGYSQREIINNDLDYFLKIVNNINATSKEIFKACYELKSLSINKKISFVEKVLPKIKPLVQYYIESTNLEIEYHKELIINKYVSEVFDEILEYADKKKKIVFRGNTGDGKTTAIFKKFTNYRNNKRVLFLAPLKVIVNQLEGKYPEHVYLTGDSRVNDFLKAKTASFVVATYEQGLKYFDENFDYIFIDEFHNTVSANSFKKNIISNLTTKIIETQSIVIGLTATPVNILRETNFKFLNIICQNNNEVQVIERNDNRSGIKILKQHQTSVNGKVIYRYNNINVLKDFQKELINIYNYKSEEIFLLCAENATPSNYDYQYLITERKFRDSITIVLTTSFIDEGLSIEQDGFTDVVFIDDKNYNPRAEPIKQFFARFRNLDSKRINYLYKKKRKNQATYFFNEEDTFKKTYEYLKTSKLDHISIPTYNTIIRDNDYYTIENKINDFYIAYKVSDQFYKKLNNYQFSYFLKYNFNLSLNLDVNYQEDNSIETSFHKKEKKIRDEKLLKLWKENVEVIKSFINEWSKDIKLRKDKEKFIYTDEQADLIEDNLKDTEARLSLYYRAERIRVSPGEIIFKDDKLRSIQSAKNELMLKETICLINRPFNKTDKKHQEKILKYLGLMYTETTFTMKKAKKLFKEHVSFISLTNEKLIRLIEQYAQITYDKRKKIYKVKHCFLDFKKVGKN